MEGGKEREIESWVKCKIIRSVSGDRKAGGWGKEVGKWIKRKRNEDREHGGGKM